MDIKIVEKCTSQSLEGKISFPEVVSQLASAGVEKYCVDLINFQKTTYGISDETHVSVFKPINGKVSENFNEAAVKLAIDHIQQGKINYLDFLQKIMLAGCSHYEVFLSGKKVLYIGRHGAFHEEFFPNKL